MKTKVFQQIPNEKDPHKCLGLLNGICYCYRVRILAQPCRALQQRIVQLFETIQIGRTSQFPMIPVSRLSFGKNSKIPKIVLTLMNNFSTGKIMLWLLLEMSSFPCNLKEQHSMNETEGVFALLGWPLDVYGLALDRAFDPKEPYPASTLPPMLKLQNSRKISNSP